MNVRMGFWKVVYRTIPTSNHNIKEPTPICNSVVYRTIPTSNHNFPVSILHHCCVVYRTIPISNHNKSSIGKCFSSLYIVLFLHQTTTLGYGDLSHFGCISYYSYIKPQHVTNKIYTEKGCISYYSYIKPQHRTIITILL